MPKFCGINTTLHSWSAGLVLKLRHRDDYVCIHSVCTGCLISVVYFVSSVFFVKWIILLLYTWSCYCNNNFWLFRGDSYEWTWQAARSFEYLVTRARCLEYVERFNSSNKGCTYIWSNTWSYVFRIYPHVHKIFITRRVSKVTFVSVSRCKRILRNTKKSGWQMFSKIWGIAVIGTTRHYSTSSNSIQSWSDNILKLFLKL